MIRNKLIKPLKKSLFRSLIRPLPGMEKKDIDNFCTSSKGASKYYPKGNSKAVQTSVSLQMQAPQEVTIKEIDSQLSILQRLYPQLKNAPLRSLIHYKNVLKTIIPGQNNPFGHTYLLKEGAKFFPIPFDIFPKKVLNNTSKKTLSSIRVWQEVQNIFKSIKNTEIYSNLSLRDKIFQTIANSLNVGNSGQSNSEVSKEDVYNTLEHILVNEPHFIRTDKAGDQISQLLGVRYTPKLRKKWSAKQIFEEANIRLLFEIENNGVPITCIPKEVLYNIYSEILDVINGANKYDTEENRLTDDFIINKLKSFKPQDGLEVNFQKLLLGKNLIKQGRGITISDFQYLVKLNNSSLSNFTQEVEKFLTTKKIKLPTLMNKVERYKHINDGVELNQWQSLKNSLIDMQIRSIR